MIGFVAGMPGRIASVAGGMWDGIKNAFRSAINWIIGAWNGLEFKLPSFGGVKVLGRTLIPGLGATLGTPNIPYIASGGIATSSGLAVVGEEGPELASFPRGAGVVPLPAGGAASPTTINLNLTVGTLIGGGMEKLAGELVDHIHDALLRKQRRQSLGFRAS